MKFIVDKAISLNGEANGGSKDLLHTKQYADILLQGIKDAPLGESYTIGLFGEWGSGKSSVIETMSAKAGNDERLKKVKIVNYDAWKYSGYSFRRMFLYELRNALGITESPLMQRATESFEQHIQELAIPKDVNVLQIIATHGSNDGIDGVWSVINPILADGKNQNQKNIDGAIQILLSFSRLTNKQVDALTGNVKALPANKVTEDKKQEILKYIEDHQL